MPRRVAHFLAALSLASSFALGQEPGAPFVMPAPPEWGTETLPFPLEFAPELPYRGLEELRFAPGMFAEGSEDFWSYAFVWWIDRDDPFDRSALATHLESYFRGLTVAVGETRAVDVSGARVSARIEPHEAGGFTGRVETFDAFTTRQQVELNVRGEIVDCPGQDARAVLFAFSPQASGHPIWSDLDSILSGFRCSASDDDDA